ncbi:MAG: helix-turn-helix transcriptional regulator, partial [Gemmatimonadota bacterium]
MAILKGTLDILVLKTLSWGPMHAFEITSWLEQRSGGRFEVDDSALIQAVHRMEARGLLTAEWGVTENDRRARYYRLTAAGRAHLRAEGAE